MPAPLRPAAAALAVLRRAGAATVVAWLPPSGPRLVGLGEAAALSGPVDSAALRRDAAALLASAAVIADDALPALLPRMMGGFAFDPRTALDPPWARFGVGRLILPRWTYGQEEDRAWLSLAVAGPLTARDRGRALEELDQLRAHLDGLAGVEPEPRSRPHAEESRASEVRGEPRAEWKERVDAILKEVEVGRVDKIVAARAAELDLEPSTDPTAVLNELVDRFERCTGFYLELNGEAFLGATPERLLSLTGKDVSTAALAGSARPGGSAALLESAKDRLEHRIVVDEVAAQLRPLCEEVRLEEMRTLELPNIAHLHTPIRARARKDTGLLDLVAALHPTPAVAGAPRGAAVRWIGRSEPVSRGWYAGPFGWIDASGDGEFVVALRSGLIRDDRALLYAGAGIVSGSDPESEWEETEAKMQAFRQAVGNAVASGGAVPA